MTRIYLSKYYSVVEVFISHMNPHQWPGDPERLLSSLTWAMYVGRNASKLWYELNQCSLTYYSLFKQRDWYTCTMSSMKYARFGFTDKAVFLRWSLVWDGLTPFLIDRSLSAVPSPFFSQLPCPRKRALLCIALLFTGSWHIARASWSVFWCQTNKNKYFGVTCHNKLVPPVLQWLLDYPPPPHLGF